MIHVRQRFLSFSISLTYPITANKGQVLVPPLLLSLEAPQSSLKSSGLLSAPAMDVPEVNVPAEVTAEMTQILSNLVLGDNDIRSSAEKVRARRS